MWTGTVCCVCERTMARTLVRFSLMYVRNTLGDHRPMVWMRSDGTPSWASLVTPPNLMKCPDTFARPGMLGKNNLRRVMNQLYIGTELSALSQSSCLLRKSKLWDRTYLLKKFNGLGPIVDCMITIPCPSCILLVLLTVRSKPNEVVLQMTEERIVFCRGSHKLFLLGWVSFQDCRQPCTPERPWVRKRELS